MVAATVAILDPATGVLAAAGGGAEYPLMFRRGRGICEEIGTSGLVIGAYAESVCEATEARRDKREFFGNEGVASAVEKVARQTDDPETVAMAIIDAARAYSASGIFRDDVCLLVVRRDAPVSS